MGCASLGRGIEVVRFTRSVTVCFVYVCIERAAGTLAERKCVCACNSNCLVVSECVLICVQGKGCGDVNVGGSGYGMLCVKVG